MEKQILLKDEARKALKIGIDAVHSVVAPTLGPKGRNIVLDRGFQSPLITNDGVSIAREVFLADRIPSLGAEIIKDVANKTNDRVGDGTSTAIVLTHAIFEEGMKHLDSGVNAIALKNGILKAANYVVEELKKMAVKFDDISQIATISAESEEIGKIIAETIKKAGNEATITVEESQIAGITSEVVNGMKLDRGFISPYMVTDPEKMTAEYTNIPVLLTDKKLISARDVLPLLEHVVAAGRNELFIVCDGIEGDALSTFILNKLKGVFKITAIELPGFGNSKKELLQDIAAMVGGQIFSDETGVKFDKCDFEFLGIADKVIVSKDDTVIVGQKSQTDIVAERVSVLKKQREKIESKIDKKMYDDRIARLSGGVAVIKVGAATEAEMKYLKLKIEDAANATKAAIEEGVVAGGGSALAKISGVMVNGEKRGLRGEASIGFEIIKKAILAPMKQIIINTGLDDGSFMIRRIQESKEPSCGYDAFHEVFVDDMIKAGIIDPIKVTRTALSNAASAAATLLTTEGVIAEILKDKNEDNG